MTKDEVLKMALEALIWTTGSSDFSEGGQAYEGAKKCLFPVIIEIKKALSQSEQEPIGYLSVGGAERLVTKKQTHEQIRNFRLFANDVFVYTTPPRRTWVGLTDDEIEHVRNDQPWWAIRAIEDKLKEKNGGHI